MSRLLLAAALAMGVAACGGDGRGSDVLPIEGILAGQIEIVPDASGRAAVFEVETSIPVACSVVYGTDDSFGSLAVDNDMQGGAHEVHRPLLTGLEPETEYRYVLQGSDRAGNLYRSEVMTFTTPAAAPGPVNLAPAGEVSASSEFSPAFAASLAIDGDPGTEWSSAGDGDDAWIEVDLLEPRRIGGFAYRTRRMTDGSSIVESFRVVLDGAETLGPFVVLDGPVVLDPAASAQVVRFEAIGTTGGNTGAIEVEIHAAP